MRNMQINEHQLTPKLRLDLGARYADLKDFAVKQFATQGKSPLVIRNLVSVLNAWMRWCRLADKHIIGREMDVDFQRNLGLWASEMEAEGKATRTIADRLELILPWQAAACSLSGADTLPEDFSDALSEAMERRGFTRNQLGRLAGIGHKTIGSWSSGERRPTRHVKDQVAKLEVALRLPPETLSKRLGFVIERHQVHRAAREHREVQTTYGKRLRAQSASGARLHYLRDPHENVRREWAQLIAYKVDDIRAHSTKSDTWRIKAAGSTGKKYDWSAVYGGSYVPAADAAWGFLSRYLAWLCLDTSKGGAGFQEDRVKTLGWIVRSDLVGMFVKWLRARSGGVVHSGMVQTLRYCCMLLRKESGWLWATPSVASAFDVTDLPASLAAVDGRSPVFAEAWRAQCERAWAEYFDQVRAYSNSKAYKPSRDPEEPIKDILDAPRPMAVLMQMLATLKRNPPPLNARKRRAVWLRDVLLFSWLIANPLRVHHFAVMTYRSDQTGNLYRDGTGTWHYRCHSDDFKNSPGDYDVTLPKFVGEAIHEYLTEGRMYLGGATEGDYVFVSERADGPSEYDATGTEVPRQPGMWTTELISARVRIITRGLRRGLPPFGPHAFRHIVATDYLKRMPGAFQLVAHLLNDSLKTVLETYGHVSAQDGLNAHYEAATKEFKRALGDIDPRDGLDDADGVPA